jgi:hypothetical protein
MNAWIVDTKYMSVSTRRFVLWFLDITGKYLLFDFYVACFTMLTLCLSFAVPQPSSSTTPAYVPAKLDVLVITQWGLYALIVGTIIAMVMNHIVLDVHKKLTQQRQYCKLDELYEAAEKEGPTHKNNKIYHKRQVYMTIFFFFFIQENVETFLLSLLFEIYIYFIIHAYRSQFIFLNLC